MSLVRRSCQSAGLVRVILDPRKLRSGQYEGAAALVAAGARLDLRNWHGWTVSHFARERSVPDFLMEAFQGQLEGCQRVSALAPGYVEECF